MRPQADDNSCIDLSAALPSPDAKASEIIASKVTALAFNKCQLQSLKFEP